MHRLKLVIKVCFVLLMSDVIIWGNYIYFVKVVKLCAACLFFRNPIVFNDLHLFVWALTAFVQLLLWKYQIRSNVWKCFPVDGPSTAKFFICATVPSGRIYCVLTNTIHLQDVLFHYVYFLKLSMFCVLVYWQLFHRIHSYIHSLGLVESFKFL